MFAENSSLSTKLPNFRNETLQSYFSLVDFRFSTSTLDVFFTPLSLSSIPLEIGSIGGEKSRTGDWKVGSLNQPRDKYRRDL